jgi:hypothetical protein
VIGAGLDFDMVASVAAEVGGDGFTLDDEYSQHEPDERMTTSFRACLCNATFTDDDWAAVAAHDSVAYVLSPPLTPETSFDAGRADAGRDGGAAARRRHGGQEREQRPDARPRPLARHRRRARPSRPTRT